MVMLERLDRLWCLWECGKGEKNECMKNMNYECQGEGSKTAVAQEPLH